MAEWISVDYAPIRRDVVAGWSGDGSSAMGWFDEHEDEMYFILASGDRVSEDDLPDVWMPLPTPPIHPDGNKRVDSAK